MSDQVFLFVIYLAWTKEGMTSQHAFLPVLPKRTDPLKVSAWLLCVLGGTIWLAVDKQVSTYGP